MKGKGASGWLTRSLEQHLPYTLEYPGSIRNKAVKEAFLQILNDIEVNETDPEKYLHALFASLVLLMEKSTANLDLLEVTSIDSAQIPQSDKVTIENIVNFLKYHFSFNYRIAGASRLPVLAVYSAYEMLMTLDRYEGKNTLATENSHYIGFKIRGDWRH